MAPVTRSRWVTFDCYGTLVDWRAGLSTIVTPIAGARAREIVSAYDRCARDIEATPPQRPYREVYVAALLKAAEDAGISLSEADARFSLSAWRELRPFGDAEALLATLRQQGYRTAVLTNCDDLLFEITHRTFQVPFDLFVTGERVRGYKPAPWHFRAFELMTHVRRTDWVHVGSSWYHDIGPTRQLGIKHVWFDRDDKAAASNAAETFVVDADGVVAAIDRLMCERPRVTARTASTTAESIAQACR